MPGRPAAGASSVEHYDQWQTVRPERPASLIRYGEACARSLSSPASRARWRLPTCRNRPPVTGRCWWRPRRSASAAPTWKSSTVITAGRRKARNASSSGTSRWAGWPRPPRRPASPPGISWSASCAGLTPFPARRARPGTGTCAPTAGTRSGGSRPGTATPASATASVPSTWYRWTRRWASSAYCSSGPASWPRPGTISSGSAPGQRGPPARRSSPGQALSGFWRRCCRFSVATRPSWLTWSPRAASRRWCAVWGLLTSPPATWAMRPTKPISSSSAPASCRCCSRRGRSMSASGSYASPAFPRPGPSPRSTRACSTATWSCRIRSCSIRQRPAALRTRGPGPGPSRSDLAR